ncbi:MAG: 4-hydroxy-tetrahydrodipicolinate reductase [Actinomycetota bacterium]
MLKVGVIGAEGRMGSEACRAITSDDSLELVARVGRDDSLSEALDGGPDVMVELTMPDSVLVNTRACIDGGAHVVVGATGLKDADLEALDAAAKEAGLGVFVAPNFALGAVLMMRFAAEAARFYAAAEIIERHHEKKVDSPSGTSLRTAELMRDARGAVFDAVATDDDARGHDASGIRIHSVRLPGSIAHQEVLFGAPGETLTLRHDSLDRASFMPGVLLAVKKVPELRGVTVGLEHLLDL